MLNQLSEQEAVNVMAGLFLSLAAQYGPVVAGELVAIAIRDAKRAMPSVPNARGHTTNGADFAIEARFPRN